ncbi:HAMP domain-containing histidine kinase [Nostoc sp. FACHB-152]|uniref:sensor histidine kinase n=1 Tax=unclassified Nostoc TaxID=2593658 RepID=UPI001683DAB0|nr:MULTISPECIES: HAMP domain-containing sensor histidine kinase [unclassified Nostoc]MBD2446851.1 HAMP domain-containing histidine kinase [Nostoc sp. FACHB-152]MBD2467812.1 HAMP domain-containing histidine kinase [Nostoc sp. FACHB-145]
MNWSNWVYIGVGLVLGMGLSQLLARSRNNASDSSPIESQEQPSVPELLQEIKQTQLAYQMAQEMSQFKAGFLARTTHELRSPLNSLIGLHQLILSDLCENPEEEREFIQQAHEKALKLLHLMDEILSVARTEYGTNKLNIQPRSLETIFQEVKDLTYMLAANRNFSLRVSPVEPKIYVLADHRWLRQVLVNLVDTAIKQMEEGRIDLSSSVSHTSNTVHIYLDVPSHAFPKSEPIDLIQNSNQPPQSKDEQDNLSPGMKLLLNQTLLDVMGGKLEIHSITTKESIEQLTRVQIFVPLAIPETVVPQPIENQVV